MKYIHDRILENGSASVYCLALLGANEPGLPVWGKLAIFAAATYKFLKKG